MICMLDGPKQGGVRHTPQSEGYINGWICLMQRVHAAIIVEYWSRVLPFASVVQADAFFAYGIAQVASLLSERTSIQYGYNLKPVYTAENRFPPLTTR